MAFVVAVFWGRATVYFLFARSLGPHDVGFLCHCGFSFFWPRDDWFVMAAFGAIQRLICRCGFLGHVMLSFIVAAFGAMRCCRFVVADFRGRTTV